MSKKKKRLKLSTKYSVTYEPREGGSLERWGFLRELPSNATLAEVIANCRKHGVEAFISAVDGENGGVVNADGTYRLWAPAAPTVR